MASKSDVVVPGDSASNQGSALMNVLDLSTVDFSKCIFTAEDYKIVESCGGKDSADKFLAYSIQLLSVVNRGMAMQCASLRSATSSVVSGQTTSACSSGFGSGKARGLSNQRVQRIQRMSSWRKNIPDGLCYSKMMTTVSAPSEAERLGSWPTVASLLRSPLSSFQSLSELERFRFVGDSDAVHVKAGGGEGFSAMGSLSWLAQSSKYPVGSLGAVIKASGETPVSGLALNHRTCVGGSSKSKVEVPSTRPVSAGSHVIGGCRVVVGVGDAVSVNRSRTQASCPSLKVTSSCEYGTSFDGYTKSGLSCAVQSVTVPDGVWRFVCEGKGVLLSVASGGRLVLQDGTVVGGGDSVLSTGDLQVKVESMKGVVSVAVIGM